MLSWFKRVRGSNSATASSLEGAADSEAINAYEKVMRAFVAAVPGAWREATIHAEIDEGSAEWTTVYISESNERRQVFIEDDLDTILRPLRASHWSKGMRWYTLDLKLQPSGKFSATFRYEKTKWMLY